ncbi:MAG: cation transporter [Chloroflexi bacterium]|nr:MAG: cation transporter [Chloroflexota bacterium]
MSHHHEHTAPESGTRLAIVVALNLTITIAEVIGGLVSGSLSLISDAMHNLSDAVAVVVAWIAIRLNSRPRNDHYTFGLKRAQLVAAIFNAGVLVAISLYLFVEAWRRFIHPEPVSGGIMTIVAGIGLAANILGTWLLARGSKENMNLRAAYLHLFSDAISSIGVILGGLAIIFFNITWIDPLLTVLIGLYVLRESLLILWRSLEIILEATPPGLSLPDIREAVLAQPGVEGLHHVHLWQVDEHDIHFEAHIELADQPLSKTTPIRESIEKMLHNRFDIEHTTLQIEDRQGECCTKELA